MKNLLFCLVLAFSLFSCNKDDDKRPNVPDDKKTVTYYYDETQCANPWDNLPAKDGRTAKLEAFLKSKNIEWKSIEVKEESDLIVACLACSCGSGFRFYVTIEEKFSKEIEKIKSTEGESGFKRVE